MSILRPNHEKDLEKIFAEIDKEDKLSKLSDKELINIQNKLTFLKENIKDLSLKSKITIAMAKVSSCRLKKLTESRERSVANAIGIADSLYNKVSSYNEPGRHR